VRRRRRQRDKAVQVATQLIIADRCWCFVILLGLTGGEHPRLPLGGMAQTGTVQERHTRVIGRHETQPLLPCSVVLDMDDPSRYTGTQQLEPSYEGKDSEERQAFHGNGRSSIFNQSFSPPRWLLGECLPRHSMGISH
jgi:hypothetical protein